MTGTQRTDKPVFSGRYSIPVALTVFASITSFCLISSFFTCPVLASEVTPERQQELISMLQHDCGACHGYRLTGGLGPPLDKNTLDTRNAAELITIISEGRKGTPMPPWKGILGAEDIAWLVDRLRRHEQGTLQ